MLSSKLHSSIGNTDQLYVDDVFSAYTYTGNGSTQTINNGIDLAGEGGMVWAKKRTAQFGNYQDGHRLQDTTRGAGDFIDSSATTASSLSGGGSFLSNGLVMAGDGATTSNSHQFISWTFRKAPKFFDVVTYTGNGGNSRSIAHSLGVAPGMIIVKRTKLSTNWFVWHKDQPGKAAYLNTTNAFFSAGSAIASVSSTHFVTSASDATDYNNNGDTYVAYLFAHDPTADGIVQCGSYVGNSSATGPVTNLGWEPQYVMIKRAVGGTGNWILLDSMRGMPVGGNDATLCANSSGAENGVLIGNWISPTATGFQITDNPPEVNGSASDTYVYLAIRRPNKPPTTGTQVYNAIARTGTGGAATVTGVGFAPDLVNVQTRTSTAQAFWQDRLRGAKQIIYPSTTTAESTDSVNVTAFLMDGFTLDAGSSSNNSGYTYINHFFRRAPGFFDVVCYTGTGVARTVPHSLGVAPELMIVKCRSAGVSPWQTYDIANGATKTMYLNATTASFAQSNIWNDTAPTSSVFTVGVNANVNATSATYVAYLFASLPGISKVGSYTGNGSSQIINCGFSTGARFILIKRTDSDGDWYVWDTARGIVAANDPHLSLNTTATEVTTNDSVDPDSTGFIVNQVAATNINVTSATYLYLAIA